MVFKRKKMREPVGEAGLFEYAVGMLARRMRTVRDLRRLMKARAVEGPEGEAAIDAVVARLIGAELFERYTVCGRLYAAAQGG